MWVCSKVHLCELGTLHLLLLLLLLLLGEEARSRRE